MLGPLVLLVAATLAYVGYEMPRAADAEQLFKGGHELTAVTLRQLETVEVQVRVAEQSTRLLADSTKRVADVIPTKISMPLIPLPKLLGGPYKIPDIAIPHASELNANAAAVAKTADSIHTTTEKLKEDIPQVVRSIQAIDESLAALEDRTKRTMKASQWLVWLISVVVAIQGVTLMGRPREDVARQTGA
jgi:hypothetical protein